MAEAQEFYLYAMGSPQQTLFSAAHRAIGYIYICTVGWNLGFSVLCPSSKYWGESGERVHFFPRITASRVTIPSPLLGEETYFSNVSIVSWFI